MLKNGLPRAGACLSALRAMLCRRGRAWVLLATGWPSVSLHLLCLPKIKPEAPELGEQSQALPVCPRARRKCSCRPGEKSCWHPRKISPLGKARDKGGDLVTNSHGFGSAETGVCGAKPTGGGFQMAIVVKPSLSASCAL